MTITPKTNGTITQDRLKEMLNYNEETGIFTRLTSNGAKTIGSQSGFISKDNGYVLIGIDGITYRAHRLAWLYVHGYLPENEIDHKDRIRHHNMIDNLRESTRKCNARNSSLSKSSTSKITGVSYDQFAKKYIGHITIDGKALTDRFDTKLEAAKFRWDMEVKYDFPECNTTSTSYLFLLENDALELVLPKKMIYTSSSIKGVSYNEQKKMWVARFMSKYEDEYLGQFDDEIDAIKTRYQAELHYKFDISKSTAYKFLVENDELRDMKPYQKIVRKMKCDVPGVNWNAADDVWTVSITVNKKRKHEGRFKDLTEAVLAKYQAEIEHNIFDPNNPTKSSAYNYLKNNNITFP